MQCDLCLIHPTQLRRIAVDPGPVALAHALCAKCAEERQVRLEVHQECSVLLGNTADQIGIQFSVSF